MATASKNTSKTDNHILLCKEIQGLIDFRNVLHTSEGFDREDEGVLVSTIQRKREQLGERAAEVQGTIDAFEKKRIREAVAHMEVQLSNRIKVLEMGEKQFGLAEARCPEMYQYFIKKQVVLLKKLNDIKKSLNIDPNQTIHRTPGASIRERHPDQKLPLPRQKVVHSECAENDTDLARLLIDSIDQESPNTFPKTNST